MSTNPSSPYRVVIIGRPNVGKSTLFNRLIGRKRALVHDFPGVTRDRINEEAQWWIRGCSMPVLVTDTGGLGGENFANEIKEQVHHAIHQADIVLFVLDSQVGLTTADEELFRELQKSGLLKKIPVIAVINKVDAECHEVRVSDFFTLGLDVVLTVSSEHGRGFDDLKQAVADQLGFTGSKFSEADSDSESEQETLSSSEEFPGELENESDIDSETPESPESEEATTHRLPRIAIVGRPNVGKSTLLNAILGENRVITSPIAGTTVDSVDVTITLQGKSFTLIDTAGIRRKSKTEQGVEVLSVVQARKTLERADLAILVLDGEKGTCDQDEKIGGLIEEAGCAVVLALNKWDTQEDNVKFTKVLAAKKIRQKMAYLKYAPIIFTSGLRGEGLDDLGELFEDILSQRRIKIPTHEFTEWMRKESTIHNPMNAKFYLCHQTGRRPPTFVCHVNDPEKIDFSLKRHLINALRERWGYMGSPIRLLFVVGKNSRSLPKHLSKHTFKRPTRKSKKLPSKQKIS